MEQRETLFNSEEMQSPFEAIKEVENVSVLFSKENFWLSQQRMAALFNVAVSTINYHLSQIEESGEVQLSTAIRKIRIPSDNCDDAGVMMYNLDVIIAVGYRVNSYEATQFRIIQDRTLLSDFDKYIEGLK